MAQQIPQVVNIPSPSRLDNKVQGDFYPLQKAELLALYQSKLINNLAYVHLALRYENPFCDRAIEIAPKEFAFRWGIPESSLYSAIFKLKNLGVIQVKTGRLTIQWEPRLNSQDSESILGSENLTPDPRIDSQSQENQPPEPLLGKGFNLSHTIQTLQTIHTLSDKGKRENELDFGKENNGLDKQVAENEDEPKETSISTASVVVEVVESNSSAILSKEKKHSPLPWIPQRDPQAQANDWIPEGPWRIDGKLDEEFLDWKARQYMRDYGDDYHAARANARLHFQKGIGKIASAWEHYHDVMSHKAVNLSVRAANGSSVGESEVEEIQRHSRALAALPEEIKASDRPDELIPDYATGTIEEMGRREIIPPGADNINCYKIYKAEEEFTPEQIKENQLRLKEMVGTIARKSSSPHAGDPQNGVLDSTSEEPTLVRLNRLLADPIERRSPHVQVQAKCLLKSDSNLVAEWEAGLISEIYDDRDIAF